MNYEIKLSGSGTLEEIKQALLNLANSIDGECEYEDATLFTKITEE